jgi:hypothetical protein
MLTNQKVKNYQPRSFVAQLSLRSFFPLPQTELAYSDCSKNAERGEFVKDRSTDLDFCNLPIEDMRREALTNQCNTVQVRFNAASALIPSQLPPQRTAQIF